MSFEKVICAGSNGVEQAAMDMALSLGREVGGVCRGGYRGIDNEEIPDRYRKHLTQWSTDPDLVMIRNVDEAHSVLVLFDTPISPHESATKSYARAIGKPTVLCSMHEALRWPPWEFESIRKRMRGARDILVVGSTLSERPEIYGQICEFFKKLYG
jgi:hypothetical protein